MNKLEIPGLVEMQESVCLELANRLKRDMLTRNSPVLNWSTYTVRGHTTSYRLLPFVAHSGIGEDDKSWMVRLTDDGQSLEGSPVALVKVPMSEDGLPIFPQRGYEWDEEFNIHSSGIFCASAWRRNFDEHYEQYSQLEGSIPEGNNPFTDTDSAKPNAEEATICRILLEDALGVY